jgi:hypothetical protein
MVHLRAGMVMHIMQQCPIFYNASIAPAGKFVKWWEKEVLKLSMGALGGGSPRPPAAGQSR